MKNEVQIKDTIKEYKNLIEHKKIDKELDKLSKGIEIAIIKVIIRELELVLKG